MPHLIHLHGPWELAKISESESRFSFSRHFGCPTNLEPNEKVFLVCDLSELLIKISLCDELLTENVRADEVFRFDITDRLQSRNQLVIEVERPNSNHPTITTSAQRIHWDADGSLVGKVRLEIINSNEL